MLDISDKKTNTKDNDQLIPEIFIFILFPTIFFIISISCLIYLGQDYLIKPILWSSTSTINLLGGNKFFVFFITISILIISAILYTKKFQALKSFLSFLAFFILANIFLTFTIFTIYRLVPEKNVISASIFIDNIEKTAFGGLPSFTIVHWLGGTIWEQIILYIYKYLFLFSSFVAIILSIFSINNFRRAMLSFMLVFIISIPFWTLIPTLSPQEIYLTKTINIGQNDSYTIDQNSFSPILTNHLTRYGAMWIHHDSFTTSNIPSAHVAWAFIFSFYLYRLNRKKLFLPAVFVVVGTILGTIYSQQHYLIDSVAGLFLGIFIVLVINNWCNKYDAQKIWFYDFIITIQNFIKNHKITKKITTLLKV